MTNRNAMDEFCTRLAEYYRKAVQDSIAYSAKFDAPMPAAMDGSNGRSRQDRIETVRAFIVDYSIHRVKWDNAKYPDGAAHCFAETAINWSTPMTRSMDVITAFADLRRALGTAYTANQGSSRTFTSLSAKLLWSTRQSEAPIYDSLALSGLISLLRVTAPMTGLSFAPWPSRTAADKADSSKVTGDCNEYAAYFVRHERLYRLFEPSIAKVDATIDPYRFFDKLLWILGGGGEG